MRSRRERMGLLWKDKNAEGDGRYQNVEYEPLEVSDAKGSQGEQVNQGKRLRLAALVISWVSVIFSFASGVAAVVLGQILDSESLFGYGLDGVLDSLSSVAVLWRFYGKASPTAAEAKERKACIVISVFFFASAFSLIFKSTKALASGEAEGVSGRVLEDIFSGTCGVITLVLATTKVYLGRKLDSRSLLIDSIITYVGSAMSFLGIVSLEVYKREERVWYLDAIFGLSCGVFLLAFGIKLIIQMTCLYNTHEPIEET